MEVEIRDFKEEDLPAVAGLVSAAFRKDWNRVVRLPDDEMASFLIDAGQVASSAFEGYIVAESEGEIVGVMSLRWAQQATPEDNFRLSNITPFGLRAVFKVLAMRYAFSEKPKAGVCHISELAVVSRAQRKGVGTALVKYGRELARKKGLSTYTLHVDWDNEAAQMLYHKMGFKIAEKKRSIMARWLFGTKEWFSMVQDI
jgi:ribosomal protein S18 acetylase RimI-like enzyme